MRTRRAVPRRGAGICPARSGSASRTARGRGRYGFAIRSARAVPGAVPTRGSHEPCPCGRLGDSRSVCRCSPAEVQRYRARLSAPLLERLDIHLEIPRVDPSAFHETIAPRRSTAELAAAVQQARQLQLARQGGYNSRLSDNRLEQVCALDCAARELLARAQQRFDMSARTRQRILKLARTVADLEGSALLSTTHVAEAVSYRFLDRSPSAVT